MASQQGYKALEPQGAILSLTNFPAMAQGEPDNILLYTLGGSITNYLFIGPREPSTTWEKTRTRKGFKAQDYIDNYYNRIHLVPQIINVGGVADTIEYKATAFNAYLYDNSLLDIQAENADGIFISGDMPTKPILALGELYFTVTITTNGPAVIDAAYLFGFTSETLTLQIVGQRLVIWPFRPEHGHQEALEWLTDVIDSYNTEQRICLRNIPRCSLNHRFLLDERQFSKAKGLLAAWGEKSYLLPLWLDMCLVEKIETGATFIPINTAGKDFRKNNFAVIWADDVANEAIEIIDISATGIYLKDAIKNNWENVFVMPTLAVEAFEGATFQRGANSVIEANINFTTSKMEELKAIDPPLEYLGFEVYFNRSVLLNDTSEKLRKQLDIFDNGLGVVEAVLNKAWAHNVQTLGIQTQSRAKIYDLKKWLHSRKGKLKPFWMPSWNKDIILTRPYFNLQNGFYVQNISYYLGSETKHILIKLYNGDVYFRKITGGGKQDEAEELLLLDTPLPYDFTIKDVDIICFIDLVRFNSDNIILNHAVNFQCALTVPLIGVSQ